MSTRASSPKTATDTGKPRAPSAGSDPGSAIAERWRSGYKNKPKRLTGPQETAALAAYKASGGDHTVASVLGISVRKLQYIVAAHPEFAEHVAEAKEWCVEHAIKTLYTMGTTSKNVAALIFYLKNRAGFADRRDSHVSVDVNVLPRIIEASYVVEAQRALPPPDAS